jgi:hypothetical protein
MFTVITQKIKPMQDKKKEIRKEAHSIHRKASTGRYMLSEWMENNEVSMKDLAFSLNVFYPQVWRWVNGTGKPGLKHAIAIESLTKGNVKCMMWGEDPDHTLSKPLDKNKPKVPKNSKSQHAKKQTSDRPKVTSLRKK